MDKIILFKEKKLGRTLVEQFIYFIKDTNLTNCHLLDNMFIF